MKNDNANGKFVAIVTGAFSILIGVIYLLLVTILDLRGAEMSPPPPEAFGEGVVSSGNYFSVVQQLF